MNMTEARNLSRRFQVWKYGASHSQLLLLSPKDQENTKRHILLFKGVEHINCPCEFFCKQIKIECADEGKIFELVSNEETYFIVARKMFEEIDKCEIFESSNLLEAFTSGAASIKSVRN